MGEGYKDVHGSIPMIWVQRFLLSLLTGGKE